MKDDRGVKIPQSVKDHVRHLIEMGLSKQVILERVPRAKNLYTAIKLEVKRAKRAL